MVQERKLKNFLLDPSTQLKIGLISVIVSISFAALLILMVYLQLNDFFEIVLELTDLETEIRSTLAEYIFNMGFWLGLASLSYVLVNVAFTIFLTHRLIGPTYAFRRHVEDLIKGRYQSRVHLRRHDAFKELADKLNVLAASLESQRKRDNG